MENSNDKKEGKIKEKKKKKRKMRKSREYITWPDANLDIQNELMVIAGGGNVARGMQSPSDAIDAGVVIQEKRHWRTRKAHVQDNHPCTKRMGQRGFLSLSASTWNEDKRRQNETETERNKITPVNKLSSLTMLI